MRSRIRKSADYRIFAPARSLSQLVTSFFGSWCQGIRLVLFVTWPLACLFSFLRNLHCRILSKTNSFQIPTLAFMCGIFYYCFTRSENFLVFSVNQWNCILRFLSEPTKFWKNTLVIYLDFVFVVNLLIHNLILYSVFKVHSVWILSIQWWAWEDSNLRPHAYQACALTTWATSPYKLIVQKLKSP